MKITFSPELPVGKEWDEVRENIRNELSHFEGRFVTFPDHLIVRLEAIPHSAHGVAVGPDGGAQVQIGYDLLSPHTAHYQYVGSSPAVELPDEPNA